MSTLSTRFDTVARAAAFVPPTAPEEFADRLHTLYGLSQRSHYVFGSPLGPTFHRGHHLNVPRFVYFGPHTHDESLRLAFYAGFDRRDLRGSFALLRLVERLAIDPDLGQGLNLSFFPLIDVAGLFHNEAPRGLERAHWQHSSAPEIDLLQKDARVRGYHAFVRIETAHDEDEISAGLRGQWDDTATPGVELISSDDFHPHSVRWEAVNGPIADGPLTLNDDLPFRAFEFTLRVPSQWEAPLYREAVGSVLKNFILRYRTLQAYGQHL